MDFFDALTMERPYRAALPDRDAMAMVQVGSGGHFDPLLVDAFLDNRARFLEIRDRIQAEAEPPRQA